MRGHNIPAACPDRPTRRVPDPPTRDECGSDGSGRSGGGLPVVLASAPATNRLIPSGLSGNGALEIARTADLQQANAQGFEPAQGQELVGRNVENGHHGLQLTAARVRMGAVGWTIGWHRRNRQTP
jgi:hypothetical protein